MQSKAGAGWESASLPGARAERSLSQAYRCLGKRVGLWLKPLRPGQSVLLGIGAALQAGKLVSGAALRPKAGTCQIGGAVEALPFQPAGPVKRFVINGPAGTKRFISPTRLAGFNGGSASPSNQPTEALPLSIRTMAPAHLADAPPWPRRPPGAGKNLLDPKRSLFLRFSRTKRSFYLAAEPEALRGNGFPEGSASPAAG